MLFRAIAGLEEGSTTPKDYFGPHLKAHTFAPENFVGKVDVAVFLFGDVAASVVSTRKRRYTKEHFENCGAGHLSPEDVDIYDADHLNLEKMFDAWMCRSAIPHICVRYGHIHRLAAAISAFIDIPFTLPRKRRRRTRLTDIPSADRDRIRHAYASLSHKVSTAPDLSLWY